MKAILKNYRQAPRKVSLIAGLIRDKKVLEAEFLLNRLIKRGAEPILKLLKSAKANAKTNNKLSDNEIENLKIQIQVNKGVVLKRFMPRAQGSASPIHKHTSNVILELKGSFSTKEDKKAMIATNEKEIKVVKKVATKKVAKKVAKKITKK